MMMPILEQSPDHHHHGHGHQTFYHEQHSPEQTGKMQLTLILPNGVPSVINVDANTPMMDLLVQAASLNKLNPSGYSLVVLDSNQHVIHFKANQTVGQIVKNCHLPQINGSSTISLLPKETSHPNPSPKSKTQPFEITVRLQVNLPDAQKILLRVDPTLPLQEIKEQICKQKKYIHSNQYALCLPHKIDQPLLLGLSLAEYKTNELTLIHNKQVDSDRNQLQSFDRLYRTRSESQPIKETLQEIQNEQQLNNTKQNFQLNTNRSSTLRPSHTSLHAYWNDPNFDTQSQISNSSSILKKRRAPRPPGYISPNRVEPEIVYIHQRQPPLNTHSPSPPPRIDHHESHESLQSENTKKKRKAPVVAPTTNPVQEKDENEQQQIITNNITRPGLQPPPPPVTITVEDSTEIEAPQQSELTINPVDDQHSSNLESTNISPSPIYSQVQKTQTHQEESEQKSIIDEPPRITSPVPKPPRQNIKSSSIAGLIRIINDHNERAQMYQDAEKQSNENISYFRVAKSRYGKFETDNRGFVNNSIAIFDSNAQQRNKNSHSSEISSSSTQQKSLSNTLQHQTKGKQAYDLLKKYEKEEELQSTNNEKEKSPTPIQLEVTERITHITVTVESDRKRFVRRTSPIQQASPPSVPPPPPPPPPPPIVAPKPVGKTITEYRTARRIGGGSVPSIEVNNMRSTSIESSDRRSRNSGTPHESLMEAIRRFGGSQNLGKN